jgi:selenocysteine lyase/cysteine desulfurase
MTYSQERDEFIAQMAREGLPTSATRRILTMANRLQRCAELACMDALDHDRLDEQIRQLQRNVVEALENYPGFTANFHNDPRGPVLNVAVPNGLTDAPKREGICVPAKGLPATLLGGRR